MKTFLLILLSAIALASTPELPRVLVDTSPPIQTGTVVKVPAGGDLQAAINLATPGDTIVLTAGASYVGNFELPAKNSPDKWIVIKTSGVLPTNRVSPGSASVMPKILSPNAMYAIKFMPKASRYRLVGLEVGINPTVPLNQGLIEVGAGDSTQTTVDLAPHHIVIEKCYIHGTPTSHSKRGIALNSGETAVIDSNISEIHGWGQDTQAIGGFNGPGPYKIKNNTLEGAGENVIFGGADPTIPNLVPSDIEIRSNTISKPLSWRLPVPGFEANGAWLAKNLLELKNAQRVLIEGNTIENSWVHGQTGFAILLTVRNQDGTCPWCVVKDVTIRSNTVRHAGSAVNILGTDDNHPSQNTERVSITDNTFDDINGKTYGGSYGTCMLLNCKGGVDSLTYSRNTCSQSQHIVIMGNHNADGSYDKCTNFVYTGNVVNHNDYGFFGDNTGIGKNAIETYFPGAVIKHNMVIRNEPTSPSAKSYPQASNYPDMSGAAFIFVNPAP